METPTKVPKGKPRNRKQAVTAALRGDIDTALEVLLDLHSKGDAAASASVAEIYAFQGRWKELVPYARALLANKAAVNTANVVADMKALLAAAAGKLGSKKTERPNRAQYVAAVEMAEASKRFKGKPRELANHCFALAVAFHLDDETIARWDPAHPYMHFDAAADVARALVRRGEPERAWEALESRLGRWYPVDVSQVLPVVLLTDPWLAPLITRERAEQVMRTPRAI